MTTKASRSKVLEMDQETDNSPAPETTSTNVLEFLRKSNIINMDMPLKTLFESVETLQSDPTDGWGIIGDSGHLVLVWKSQEK